MINSILNAAISAVMVFAAIYMVIGFLCSVATYQSFAHFNAVSFAELPEPELSPNPNRATVPDPSMVVQTLSLDKMTWRQLVKVAKVYGVKNRRNLTKVQLVAALQASV